MPHPEVRRSHDSWKLQAVSAARGSPQCPEKTLNPKVAGESCPARQRRCREVRLRREGARSMTAEQAAPGPHERPRATRTGGRFGRRSRSRGSRVGAPLGARILTTFRRRGATRRNTSGRPATISRASRVPRAPAGKLDPGAVAPHHVVLGRLAVGRILGSGAVADEEDATVRQPGRPSVAYRVLGQPP